MTRDEILSYMHSHPGVKVTHLSFAKHEYLYMKANGYVYDESDYLFEDWDSNYKNCGMRVRTTGYWESSWSLYDEND